MIERAGDPASRERLPHAGRLRMPWRARYLLIGGVALVAAVGLIGWHFFDRRGEVLTGMRKAAAEGAVLAHAPFSRIGQPLSRRSHCSRLNMPARAATLLPAGLVGHSFRKRARNSERKSVPPHC